MFPYQPEIKVAFFMPRVKGFRVKPELLAPQDKFASPF